VEQQFNVAEDALRDTVKEMIQVQRRVPVFYGAVLTSKTGNILMFRGTQQNAEWIRNFLAVQEPYRDAATGKTYGQVHSGFLDIYSNLILEPRPHKIAEQLDPTVPCYIAGHSLGGALAILAAIDIALKVPKLRPNLRLYTYGSPRVGDKIFAEAHSQLIPNSYRVANQADTITLVPPTNQMGGVFIHIGEEWAFLSQNQDVMPNHIVDTYRVAIDREQETRSIKSWHQIHKG
jgi:predicted lipase